MTLPASPQVNPSAKESGYRSPKRCLLHAFDKSRKRWKEKTQQRNREIKVLKVRVSDLERSRQRYRDQVQQAQAALQQVQQKVAQLQAQLQAQGAEAPPEPEKKSPCSMPHVRAAVGSA